MPPNKGELFCYQTEGRDLNLSGRVHISVLVYMEDQLIYSEFRVNGSYY